MSDTKYLTTKIAESKRSDTIPNFGATAFDHFVHNPTKRCCACSNGTVIEDGQLRTCTTCKGLGYLRMSLEEIRDEYRAIRTRVCDVNPRFSEEDFHEATRRWVTKQGDGRDTPGYYLAAARSVEGKELLERVKRRLETRSKW